MSKRQSTAWKSFERTVAEQLGGVRVVRSSYGDSNPDVVCDDVNLVADAKLREAWSFHSIFKECRDKYARDGKRFILATRCNRKHQTLITMDMTLFQQLLAALRQVEEAEE